MAKKADMIKELEKHEIFVPKNMTVPELTTLLKRLKEKDSSKGKELTLKKDFMASLSERRKETLIKLVIDLGGLPGRKWTKGDALLWIREEIPKLSQEKVGFGKYQNQSMETCSQDCTEYVKWCLDECSSESHEKMKRFTAYCKVIYRGILKDEQDSESEEREKKPSKPKGEFKKESVKEEKVEEKPKMKESSSSRQVPVPDSDLEEESDSEDPKKKKKISARPIRRPETFPLESDSSATSWMELSGKRKHQDRPAKKRSALWKVQKRKERVQWSK